MTPGQPHPLDEVYKKFEHLDKCLSDTKWCENAGDGSAIYGIAGELWRAIKAARASHSAAKPALPEEMSFSLEEIPQKKFVITESQLNEISGKCDSDIDELCKIITGRIISVGGISGAVCAKCLKPWKSGYDLCEKCFHEIITYHPFPPVDEQEIVKMLDDIIAEINKSLKIVSSDFDNPDRYGKMKAYFEIRDYLDTIRQKKEEK